MLMCSLSRSKHSWSGVPHNAAPSGQKPTQGRAAHDNPRGMATSKHRLFNRFHSRIGPMAGGVLPRGLNEGPIERRAMATVRKKLDNSPWSSTVATVGYE